MAIIIKTNHHKRPVLCGSDLTAKERKDFDYYSWPGGESQHPEPTRRGEDAEFVRYHERLYDLGDTEGTPLFTADWDLYISDSFFSGVLFRYARYNNGSSVPSIDDEHVICGTFYSS